MSHKTKIKVMEIKIKAFGLVSVAISFSYLIIYIINN